MGRQTPPRGQVKVAAGSATVSIRGIPKPGTVDGFRNQLLRRLDGALSVFDIGFRLGDAGPARRPVAFLPTVHKRRAPTSVRELR